jgi:hypothetical protein
MQEKTMAPGFDMKSLNELGKLIGTLERLNLEGAVPAEFQPEDLLDDEQQAFFQVQGLADFWTRDQNGDFKNHSIDMVISAHGQRMADLTLILLGTPQRLSIYLSLGPEQTTQTLLEGIFPGIHLQRVSREKLITLIKPHCKVQGVLTGIPSRKEYTPEHFDQPQQSRQAAPSTGQQSQSLLERVIRGMYGATWCYIVQAHPRPRSQVVQDRMKVVDLLTQITSRSRVQWQSTRQDSKQLTSVESGSQTHTYSGDMVNYRAQYLIKLLERELERLDMAASLGQWISITYFAASRTDDMRRLASLLLGTMAGRNSRPDPLRTAFCQSGGAPLTNFHTFLNSADVAVLTQLPREEVSGYAIHDHVFFDVDFRPSDGQVNLPLGQILQHGRNTHNTFDIALDALAKHAVVIGVTGSGKTTTVMSLLDRVVEAKRPFLVIEPAKTEYRALRSALAGRSDLRIYTLGSEMIAPFRLNPFEFQTDDEAGSTSLLTHIDFLKAVFNAAFVLYSPMPHVLEEALHEIYENKGWDLASGVNRRIPNWSQRHNLPIFPTLTDLYYKIEAVTNRLGYDREVESNVKAGLRSRIGSLRIGSKGLMLDTARGVPMSQLMAQPTILELENIGSDDEKTFIMGLLLARIYEYRRLQAAKLTSGHLSSGLRHVIVFEEAHRLLKNTTTQVDSESSNMRAQAIEVFANMLSEVRAYGQGVLVAEQIPSKLAPDVLKNTNLKIVHRMIAQDDRQSIGQTMNLTDEQMRHMGILEPGMAIVYAEGADHAYQVKMENYKQQLSPLTDKQLREISRSYASVKPYHILPEIELYNVQMLPNGEVDPSAFQAAGRLLSLDKSRRIWSRLLFCLMMRPTHVPSLLHLISEMIESEMAYLTPEQHDAMLRMVIVRGCAETLHERGAHFGWSYQQVDQLRLPLTRGLLGLIQAEQFKTSGQGENEENTRRLAAVADELIEFMQGYTTGMERRQGPFPGCTHCPVKCLYRSEVSSLLMPKDRQWMNDELNSREHRSSKERYAGVARVAKNIVQTWLGDSLEAPTGFGVPGIAYCTVLHTAVASKLTDYEQAILGDTLKPLLLD